MAKPQRKPKGEGKAALQRKARNEKARNIANEIWQRLDADLVDATGQLFPRGSTRKVAVRDLFGSWIHEIKGRVFTWKLCCSVCRHVISLLGHSPPRDPGERFSTYIGTQAERLRRLARAFRKRSSTIMNPRDLTTWDTQVPWRGCLKVRMALRDRARND